MATTLTTAARNAAADAVTALAGANGFIDIYTAAFATLLVSVEVPSWGAAVAGVSTAAAMDPAMAVAIGTAAVCKVTTSSHTEIWRGTVGTSGADVILDSVDMVSGTTVTIDSATYTQPAS